MWLTVRMRVRVRVRAESELVVRSFKHGQSNPTYYVKFGARELVVRKKPVRCRGPLPNGLLSGQFDLTARLPPVQSSPVHCLCSNASHSLPTACCVLRVQAGKLLKGAHQVEREHRVMKALAGTPVPVPRVYELCEDESCATAPPHPNPSRTLLSQ